MSALSQNCIQSIKNRNKITSIENKNIILLYMFKIWVLRIRIWLIIRILWIVVLRVGMLRIWILRTKINIKNIKNKIIRIFGIIILNIRSRFFIGMRTRTI